MKRNSHPSWLTFALGLVCGVGGGWAMAPRQQAVPPLPAEPVVVSPPPRAAPIAVAPGKATPSKVTALDNLVTEQELLAKRVDRAEFERQHSRRLEDYRENPAALVELHRARANAMHFAYSDDAAALVSYKLAEEIGERLWHRTVLRRMGIACDMGKILLNQKQPLEAYKQFRYAELVFEEVELSNWNLRVFRPIPEQDSSDRYGLYAQTINGLFDTMSSEEATKQPVYWGGWLPVKQRGDRDGVLVIHPASRRSFDAIRVLQSSADEEIDWTDADKAAANRSAELIKESLAAGSVSLKSQLESMRRKNYEVDPKSGELREAGGDTTAVPDVAKVLLDNVKKSLRDRTTKDN